MIWHVSHRADPAARVLADRHYNRQSIGHEQFAPAGSAFVLLTGDGKAFWITSAPKAEYVKHRWAGAWVNSAFRTEGPGPASELIRQAIAATRPISGTSSRMWPRPAHSLPRSATAWRSGRTPI